MNILVIDVGGTHVKILASGQDTPREFVSGPSLTAEQMVAEVLQAAEGWDFDVISMGYPGPVLHDMPVAEPRHLGDGWVGFDYESAFKRPIKIVNDAAMQALGSYEGGKMLFLGLGTGLGSAMILDGRIEPMELGHLPFKKATYEDYVGNVGLKRFGKKKWRVLVSKVVETLKAALEPEDVVIGGGNAHKLKELPEGCRPGDNNFAFKGGFRLWEEAAEPESIDTKGAYNGRHGAKGQKV